MEIWKAVESVCGSAKRHIKAYSESGKYIRDVGFCILTEDAEEIVRNHNDVSAHNPCQKCIYETECKPKTEG